MNQELVHLTVGYPRTPFMDMLEQSSLWNGCRFVGIPRHLGSARFSLLSKITLVKSYLESGDVDMDSVVMFTDAYDVLIVEHASVILEKFHASGADLLFSAETNFYPATPDGRVSTRAKFDTYDSKWRYLNSGGYIGYAWAIKLAVDQVSEWIASKNYDPTWEANDQPFMQEFFVRNSGSKACRVALDIEPHIFCCLNSDIDEFAVQRSRVCKRRTGKTISMLHANGSKSMLKALSDYWALCGGKAGVPRMHDLRIAMAGHDILAYSPEKLKLVRSHLFDPALAVFLVKGNRHAIGLIPSIGLMTFTPQQTLDAGATVVNVWELLTIREDVTTYHGTSLAPYCDAEQVTLAPLPLHFLAGPSSEDLLALIVRYEGRL